MLVGCGVGTLWSSNHAWSWENHPEIDVLVGKTARNERGSSKPCLMTGGNLKVLGTHQMPNVIVPCENMLIVEYVVHFQSQ
jgi:hypothetical protein